MGEFLLGIDGVGCGLPAALCHVQLKKGVQGPFGFRAQHSGALGDQDGLRRVAAADRCHEQASQPQELGLFGLQHLGVVALCGRFIAVDLGCLCGQQHDQWRLSYQCQSFA